MDMAPSCNDENNYGASYMDMHPILINYFKNGATMNTKDIILVPWWLLRIFGL
jgi:hypothetical protein